MHVERLLIIEDEPDAALLLSEILSELGYKSETASSLKSARSLMMDRHFDLVLLDVHLPDGDGLSLLREYHETAHQTAFIVTSGRAELQLAIEALRLGAVDYLLKPFNTSQLEIAVTRAWNWCRLRIENAFLRSEGEYNSGIVGVSAALQSVHHLIRQVGPTQATVLIHGESGTGKELVAQAIQEISPRRHQPYIRINCAAIPENLIESELFGHEKGAFTGATSKRRGRFEMADRGTLLLDEISEISMALQAKLLRVLQEREFERVGGGNTIPVDVRVIATTNLDLKEQVKKGLFREDLFFRLNVVPIYLPPLRERKGDIDLLTDLFLKLFSERYSKQVPVLAPGTREVLRKAPWPGNVRELQNTIERAVILSDGSRGLLPQDFGLSEGVGKGQLEEKSCDGLEDLCLDRVEQRYIEKALKRTGGNVTQAASLLGLSVRALHYKMSRQRANIDPTVV